MNVILVGLDGLEPSLIERWADDHPAPDRDDPLMTEIRRKEKRRMNA